MKLVTLLSVVTMFYFILVISASHIGARPSIKHKSLQDRFRRVRTSLLDGQHSDYAVSLSNSTTPFGYVNVAAFGAVADGTTDNTQAFQAALNSGAGKVFVPVGRYMFRGTVVVPPYTVLQGANEFPFSAFAGGSILLVGSAGGNVSGPAFIFLQGPDAGVNGLTILYTHQNIGASSPIVYPPCIQGNGDNLSILNMLLGNPYIAIDFATFSCPRHLIENVYGQPLSLGIEIDQIYDIGRIRHCHFWPFWAISGPMLNWVHANGVTFLIKRSDWEVVEDVFSWGYNRGMVFDRSANGACNGQFTDVDFDDVGIGIDVKHTQPYGIMFTNLNLANAGDGDTKIAIRCAASSGSNVQMVVRGLVTWGEWNQAVNWGCGGKLSLSDGLIVQWNKKYPAIQIDAGRVDIRGNYFTDTIGQAIQVSSTVDRAIVTANDLVGNTLVCDAINAMCANNLA